MLLLSFVFTGHFSGKAYSLPKFSFDNARNVFDDNYLEDILFTFGVEKSGQLVLHNYPTTLMGLKIPKHQKGARVRRYILSNETTNPGFLWTISNGYAIHYLFCCRQ